MAAIEKILLPTDFSDGAAAAMEQAIPLARAFGASITLFHVYQVPAYVFPDSSTFVAGPEVSARIEREVGAALDEAAEAARHQTGVTVLTRSTIGSPHEEIVRAAREYDLVVMGTHGHSGLRQHDRRLGGRKGGAPLQPARFSPCVSGREECIQFTHRRRAWSDGKKRLHSGISCIGVTPETRVRRSPDSNWHPKCCVARWRWTERPTRR